MPEQVAQQIVAGVSIGGYRRTLEPVAESLETKGESKRQVSRVLATRTADKLEEFTTRKLQTIGGRRPARARPPIR